MPRKVLSTVTLIPEQSVSWNVEDYRLSIADITNGQMFLNNGSCLMYVSNPAGATTDVIVAAVPDDAARTNAAGLTGDPAYGAGYKITLQASQSRYFGPFRQAWFNQTAADVGYVYVNISRATVAAYVIIR